MGFMNRVKGKIALNAVFVNFFFSANVQAALTARAGGGQALGTPITSMLSRFTTVATAADSGRFAYSAVPGLEVTVINSSGTAMQIFGAGTDTIDGVATGTGISIPGGKTYNFYCVQAGQWHSSRGA